MNAPDIILRDIHKRYSLHNSVGHGYKLMLTDLLRGGLFRKKVHYALKGVSLTIRKGESVGIIGRNGAGKSTMLGLMANVIKPSSGEIRLMRPVFAMLELGSGFHPDLTGRENILMNGVLLGLRKDTMLRKQDDIIAYSELGEFIDQPIRTYSSGMLARLGFSILVQLKPEILLLDEVFAVGDAHFQAKCRKSILALRENGETTIVLVSHDLQSVRQLCPRCIWIEDGVVKMDADTQRVVAAFATPNGTEGSGP